MKMRMCIIVGIIVLIILVVVIPSKLFDLTNLLGFITNTSFQSLQPTIRLLPASKPGFFVSEFFPTLSHPFQNVTGRRRNKSLS